MADLRDEDLERETPAEQRRRILLERRAQNREKSVRNSSKKDKKPEEEEEAGEAGFENTARLAASINAKHAYAGALEKQWRKQAARTPGRQDDRAASGIEEMLSGQAANACMSMAEMIEAAGEAMDDPTEDAQYGG